MPVDVSLPLTGLEPPLSEMERAVQDNVHRYAVEVMRPLGVTLDRLPADAVPAADSPLWTALAKAGELGLSLLALMELPAIERTRLLALATEELAWGDGGIAGAILVNNFPVMYSLLAGNLEMARACDGKLGCWAITEPDHGSDMLDADRVAAAPGSSYGRPNCTARIVGDRIIISGQKSAWVSGAMTAQVCALFCHYAAEDGTTRPGVAVIVPLDLPGVSRGRPLDKLGLRGLNQGELYFDNVEVPLTHLLAGPDDYADLAYRMLCEANPHVACVAVGVARAAFEHAWQYAHQRRQGGEPLIRHQLVRYRLFEMFRKVETARADAPGNGIQRHRRAALDARLDLGQGHGDADRLRGGLRRTATVRRQRHDARIPDGKAAARCARDAGRRRRQRVPRPQGRGRSHQS